MEDGHPGTALHTFLRALHVLDRLDAVAKVMAMEHDTLGMELMREQLPRRVRSSHGAKSQTRSTAVKADNRDAHTDDLEGF